MLTTLGCGLAVLPQEARLSAPVTLPALPLTHRIELGCVASLPVAVWSTECWGCPGWCEAQLTNSRRDAGMNSIPVPLPLPWVEANYKPDCQGSLCPNLRKLFTRRWVKMVPALSLLFHRSAFSRTGSLLLSFSLIQVLLSNLLSITWSKQVTAGGGQRCLINIFSSYGRRV